MNGEVSGVVSHVQSSIATVKTPWGTHRKGDRAHAHRFVTGNLSYTSSDRKEIKVWQPEGTKAIDVQTGRSKLSTLEEGAPVTLTNVFSFTCPGLPLTGRLMRGL